MIDIHTGDFYIQKYVCKAKVFAEALEPTIKRYILSIKMLTMDNGGENNLLRTIVDELKLYNRHAYCSGEKGTL